MFDKLKQKAVKTFLENESFVSSGIQEAIKSQLDEKEKEKFKAEKIHLVTALLDNSIKIYIGYFDKNAKFSLVKQIQYKELTAKLKELDFEKAIESFN
jgi:hypothetical protein